MDSYCLGIRDAYLVEDTEEELQAHIDEHPQTLEAMPAGYARKLVEDAIAYALFDDEFEERIVLTEGYFDSGATSPELNDSGPSEAAMMTFLKFKGAKQFEGDTLFDNPLWVYPDGETTFDAMLEVADVIMEAAPEGFGDSEMRFVFFSFMTLLMNLHGENEATAEAHLEKLQEEDSLPSEAAAFLRELRKGEEMQELLDRLVYPEPGITVRPMGVEMIDEKSGHCLFVCLEVFEPE